MRMVAPITKRPKTDRKEEEKKKEKIMFHVSGVKFHMSPSRIQTIKKGLGAKVNWRQLLRWEGWW